MGIIGYINKLRVNSILKKYNEKSLDIINANKGKLQEAFIIYYGEEYRDNIEAAFKNIDFLNFVSTDTREKYANHIESFMNSLCEEIDYKLQEEGYRIDINILWTIKENTYDLFLMDDEYRRERFYNVLENCGVTDKQLIDKLFVFFNQKISHNNEAIKDLCEVCKYFGPSKKGTQVFSSNNSGIINKSVQRKIIRFLKKFDFAEAMHCMVNDEVCLVSIPLLAVSDNTIIHELNHAVTSKRLFM